MPAPHFITAPHIHDGHRWLDTDAVIELEDDGTIVALHNGADSGLKNVARYERILCPGFVNAHCHLELSHMKGRIPPRTGLIPFLQHVMRHRNDFTDAQKKTARHEAYAELLRNGTVAVGDIANTTDSLDVRAEGKMHMHTFAECTGFVEATAGARFDVGLQILNHFKEQPAANNVILRQSLSPHAPYSVSEKLFRLIDAAGPESLLFIHNGESRAEDEYYRQKTGAVKDLLQGFGIDDSAFQPSGKSALHTYMEWLSPHHPMLFVHNIYTGREDITRAESRFPRASWCLCPAANLYIEDRLPDVMMLEKTVRNICIGTDSLASNDALSIPGELLLLKENFPELSWETLLRWGTSGGAAALGMDDFLGRITPGKKPGILALSLPDDNGTALAVQRIF